MSCTTDMMIDRMNREKVCEACDGKGFTMNERPVGPYGSGDFEEYRDLCQCVADVMFEDEIAFHYRNK